MSLPKVAAALALTLLLAACSSDPSEVYEEQPVDTLYNAAMEDLLARNYETAATKFEEVERQHPYSVWAAKAQVMSAYSYFRKDKYDEAVNAADRFIQLHPTNPDAPYAYYLKSLAYYEQIVDVGRDQRTTQRALASLEDVVRRFPETRYARDASLKLDLTRDHLAGKEMSVGRFYLKRGELLAAINRFKTVVERHQTTSHVPEALLRLTEAYTALGLKNEARRMTAILGHNYPGSPWYADAFELVEGVEVEDFPRPDEREFYERWIDPDSTIAKAERRELPDLLPGGDGPTELAGAATITMADGDRKRGRGRVAKKTRPTLSASERAARVAEAESQALAAAEAAGEWRRAADVAASEDGKRRALANADLGAAAEQYWQARGKAAQAYDSPEEAAAELALAEGSVAYWKAAEAAAEDDLAKSHAGEALKQAEAVLAYWRENGSGPTWLERTLNSAI